ncbi:MAG: hypothetical protein GQ570_07215 [Helicobacteraceae bacterium]|nr:hypothetical protein [Helicobacteraceae bacterium]
MTISATSSFNYYTHNIQKNNFFKESELVHHDGVDLLNSSSEFSQYDRFANFSIDKFGINIINVKV